jgi:hypothetical protein
MDDGLSGLRMHLAYNDEDLSAAECVRRDGVGGFVGRTYGQRKRRCSSLFAHHLEVNFHERRVE